MLSFTDCCRIVLAECPDQYGKSYAQAWLDGQVAERAASLGMTLGHAAATQALYVADNLKGWRGPQAKAVRTALKQIIKENTHVA